jgi:alpha-L-rhamnosidase
MTDKSRRPLTEVARLAGVSQGIPLRHVDERSIEGAFWIDGAKEPDVHAAFRGVFTLAADTEVAVRVLGASEFRIWLDGEPFMSGPPRFAPAFPEYQYAQITLAQGDHLLAAHARSDRLANRAQAELPGFLWVTLTDSSGEDVAIAWRGRRLTEYRTTGLRVSPLLGWVEWQTQPVEPTWRSTGHTGIGWAPVVQIDVTVDAVAATTSRGDLLLPAWPRIELQPIASGFYRDTFTGYELDDLSSQFVLADLRPASSQDHDGTWLRYDLGRIRIGALELDLSTEAAAVVRVGYAERISPDGRVAPVSPLSTGPTRLIQHFELGAGRHLIEPLQSLGGRWLEVHISDPGARVHRAAFRDRDLLGEPVGTFACDDDLLERIWEVGVETLRSATEDSVVDSVRERAEWLGDIAGALEITAVSHGNFAAIRRALVHAAATARPDGIVAGCTPGDLIYVSTFAAGWVTGCLRYAELGGDLALLEDLFGASCANLSGILALIDQDGGTSRLPWSFVDWGYAPAVDGLDFAALLHIRAACLSWLEWRALIQSTDAVDLVEKCHEFDRLVQRLIAPRSASELGFHATVLASRFGLREAGATADHVVRHIGNAFPFAEDGPRLRSPLQVSPGVVTPYFLNFALPVLFEAGRTDEALEFIRTGWGWMLESGATTWWEVFDDRWSQCHVWSGGPTWLLTRYLLGIWPVLHEHASAIALRLVPGSIGQAEGVVPSPFGPIAVHWIRSGTEITLTMTSQSGFPLLGFDGDVTVGAQHRVTLVPAVGAPGVFVPDPSTNS